ncbi:MAG: NADH-quinone oxidoreductase subunit K [Deltaproteobacteria bacterium]|nr:NADH-quinone oxidoreductase subunit K [Deltaproteobacteria bacterium]
MNISLLYSLVGLALFSLGLYGLIAYGHLLRKILAVNVMGSGAFLILVALARGWRQTSPDPVPHAMGLTGLVVAVSATALALALACRVQETTGSTQLTEDGSD